MGWGRREQSELDRREEMLAHIRLEADRLIEAGVEPSEAMRRARARFGTQEEISPTRFSGLTTLELLGRDVRHAARQLRRSPGTTLTILLSLIIGIGVNTAIFSLADQALLRPMDVPEPHRLVQFDWDGRFIGEGRGWGSLIPHPLFEAVREEQAVFSGIAARSLGEVTLVTEAGSERADVALVTGTFFEVMGIRPELGRLIDREDDRILGEHPVLVLSHRYWQSRFAGDPAVLGRSVLLNGQPFTVIGVAPEGFFGTDWSSPPVAWTSMQMNPVLHDWGTLDAPRIRFQHVFARLALGVSRADAEAALQPWFQRYIRADMERGDWPGNLEPGAVSEYLASRLALLPGGSGQAARIDELTRPVLILTTATALLLLLACLNVANLSLARAVARHRETAVRAALGASRGRIMTERLVEAGLLAALGGAAGTLTAPFVGAWILRYLEVGTTGMALESGLDSRTLLTAVGIAVAATLLSGAGPAWFASTTRPMGALRTRVMGRGGIGLRKALVVGQVGLALVLLVGAGLFGATLKTLRDSGPGFETSQLLTFTLNPQNDGYERAEAKVALADVFERVSKIPGVESAGLSRFAMLTGGGWGNDMLVEGRERFVTEEAAVNNAVTPGFFETLGIDLVRGRDFDSSDRTFGDEWSWTKAIVSQSFVDRWLPDQEPLGVRIDFGRDPSAPARMEIVGVVEDYREQQLREHRPQVYFPFEAMVFGGGAYYLRSRAPLAAVAQEIRRVVAEIDGGLTVADVRTMDEQIDRLLVFERLLSALGNAFALFGTILAMIGIYGVLSFSAQSRTREVGIRMALGAPRAWASGEILREAMRLVAVGVLLALPTIWFLGGLIQNQLYGVQALDPLALFTATASLLAVCFAASALPAWRMSRTDPAVAFRAE